GAAARWARVLSELPLAARAALEAPEESQKRAAERQEGLAAEVPVAMRRRAAAQWGPPAPAAELQTRFAELRAPPPLRAAAPERARLLPTRQPPPWYRRVGHRA